MYENRIKHLEESHRVLDKRIDQMEISGTFTDLDINNLKKQRLHYRDEIAKLKRLQWEHDNESVDFDDER
jgi:hypothetical protein